MWFRVAGRGARCWPSGRAGLLAVFLLLLAALAVGCRQGGAEEGNTPEGIVVQVTTPTPPQDTPPPTRSATPTPSPAGTPLQVCGPNPDPAPPSVLQVQEPKPQQKVGVPFHVSGWGATIGFQDTGVAVALVNAKQEVVQVLDVPPQPRTYRVPPSGLEITQFTRPFGADVVLSGLTGPTPFCLWVYLEATADGTPKGVVQVPVVVAP